jgi:hypothetical protein
MGGFLNTLFDEKLMDILDPDELIYVAILMQNPSKLDNHPINPTVFFCETSAYKKLLDYYSDEMPYGVAKCRTGEPDSWILDRLQK